MEHESPVARRPLKSRGTRWAAALSRGLVRTGISPNQISIASIGFAFMAAVAYLLLPYTVSVGTRVALLALAIAGVQLRLLCNLMDGMVAIEGGRKTSTGEIYNDLPDRIADPLILVPVGYAIETVLGVTLGWSAGLLSIMTAYVRMLGGSVGLAQDFVGPMAKPHRMAMITGATLVEIGLTFTPFRNAAFVVALVVIVVGAIVTAARRTSRIAKQMRAR